MDSNTLKNDGTVTIANDTERANTAPSNDITHSDSRVVNSTVDYNIDSNNSISNAKNIIIDTPKESSTTNTMSMDCLDNGKDISDFELISTINNKNNSDIKNIEKEIKITHTFLENYENSKLTNELPLKYNDKSFVLLDIQIPCHDPIYENVSWIFSIDTSGSMDGVCKDGKTKIEHLKQTFKKMLDYFIDISDKFGINQTITILTFNELTDVVCKETPITVEFVNNFKDTIDEKFESAGSTDINTVLSFVKEYVQNHHLLKTQSTTYNKSHIIHIFMSDGEATIGVTDKNIIKENVVNNNYVYNSFIGFGEDHDIDLMKVLAKGSSSDYFYVKDIDQASSVYAETIYNGLYQYIKNVKITIEDDSALIYNFDENKWSRELEVDNLTSGAIRNFHITVAKYNPDIKIAIEYELYGKKHKVYSNYNNDNVGKLDVETYKYLWRQETLDLLFDIDNYVSTLYNSVTETKPMLRRDALTHPFWDHNKNYDFGLDLMPSISKNNFDKHVITTPKRQIEKSDYNSIKRFQRQRRNNRCCLGMLGIVYYNDIESDSESYSSSSDSDSDNDSGSNNVCKNDVCDNDLLENKPNEEEKEYNYKNELNKLNILINCYFKQINSFIEKYNLFQDDFMKQLVSSISSSQTSLLENNSKLTADIHSRCLTLGRQRSHDISDDRKMSNSQSSCFRNTTLSDIISKVSNTIM